MITTPPNLYPNGKTCTYCLQSKPIDQFSKKSSSWDGLSSKCKKCASEYRAARRAANPTPRRVRSASSAPTLAPSAAMPITTAADDYVPSPEVLATWAAAQLIVRRGGLAETFYFVGPSGSGKSACAEHLARLAGMDFTKVDAPSITDPEAWFGTREVVETESGSPVTVVRDSAFITAIQKPGVVLVDEANRIPDSIRQITLGLADDSRAVTNPLTGQPILRNRECFVIMTGNVGLAFTGTYAMDPSLTTRMLTTHFDYLEAEAENKLVRSRTGVDETTAGLFVRFANEARQRAKTDEDFTPISTREVLKMARLAAVGLDANTAAHQAVINAASDEGGAESARAQLEYIWNGIRPK